MTITSIRSDDLYELFKRKKYRQKSKKSWLPLAPAEEDILFLLFFSDGWKEAGSVKRCALLWKRNNAEPEKKIFRNGRKLTPRPIRKL